MFKGSKDDLKHDQTDPTAHNTVDSNIIGSC